MNEPPGRNSHHFNRDLARYRVSHRKIDALGRLEDSLDGDQRVKVEGSVKRGGICFSITDEEARRRILWRPTRPKQTSGEWHRIHGNFALCCQNKQQNATHPFFLRPCNLATRKVQCLTCAMTTGRDGVSAVDSALAVADISIRHRSKAKYVS